MKFLGYKCYLKATEVFDEKKRLYIQVISSSICSWFPMIRRMLFSQWSCHLEFSSSCQLCSVLFVIRKQTSVSVIFLLLPLFNGYYILEIQVHNIYNVYFRLYELCFFHFGGYETNLLSWVVVVKTLEKFDTIRSV